MWVWFRIQPISVTEKLPDGGHVRLYRFDFEAKALVGETPESHGGPNRAVRLRAAGMAVLANEVTEAGGGLRRGVHDYLERAPASDLEKFFAVEGAPRLGRPSM